MPHPEVGWDGDVSMSDIDMDFLAPGLNDHDLALSFSVEALEEMCRLSAEDFTAGIDGANTSADMARDASNGDGTRFASPFSQMFKVEAAMGPFEMAQNQGLFPPGPVTPGTVPPLGPGSTSGTGPSANIARSQSATLPNRGGTPQQTRQSPELGMASPPPAHPPRILRYGSVNAPVPLGGDAWGQLQTPDMEAEGACRSHMQNGSAGATPWSSDAVNAQSSVLPTNGHGLGSNGNGGMNNVLVQDLQQMVISLQKDRSAVLKRAEELTSQLATSQKRVADLEKQLRACVEGMRREGATIGTGVKPPPGYNPNAQLVCHIRGESRIIKAEKAAKLPWDPYIALYTSHVETAREIIKHGLPASGSSAALRMEALGRQLATLLVTQAVVAPRNLCRLHCVKIQPGISTERPPPDAWRGVMADLHLTPTQIQAAGVRYRAFQGAMSEVLSSRDAILAELNQQGGQAVEPSFLALAHGQLRVGVLRDTLGTNLDNAHSHAVALTAWFLQECLMPVQLSMLFMFSFPYIPDFLAIIHAAVSGAGDIPPGAPLFAPKPRSAPHPLRNGGPMPTLSPSPLSAHFK